MARILIASKQNGVLRKKWLGKLCTPNGKWCDTHSFETIRFRDNSNVEKE
jgi:hypothetical protein